jgi:hypothetical protein
LLSTKNITSSAPRAGETAGLVLFVFIEFRVPSGGKYHWAKVKAEARLSVIRRFEAALLHLFF